MTSRAPDRRSAGDRWLLLALCLAGFAWRLIGLDFQSLWRDESDALLFAGRPWPELLRTFSRPGENGPLFFLALRPWLELAGRSEFALRFPSALAGVLAIPLTYVLARRLLRLTGAAHLAVSEPTLSNVPLLAGVLTAVNPYLAWYSQEGKMYAGLVVLILGAHLAFLAAVEAAAQPGPRWLWRSAPWWLLYLVLLALAALTHVLAVLVVAVHGLWLLALGRRYRRAWLPLLGTLALPALPYYALVGWWQLRLFLDPRFQTGHPAVSLPTMAEAMVVGFTLGVAIPPSVLPLALAIFLLLAGLLLSGEGRRAAPRLSLMLAAWLAGPLLLLFAISLRKPMFTDRYLIWTLPAAAMTAAVGVAAVGRSWRRLGWAVLALLVGLGLAAGWRQTHTPIKSDFRAAAAHVRAHAQPGDRLLFLIPHIRPTFEYYAGPQPDGVDGPYTNGGMTEAQLAEEMARSLQGASAVWLVASEAELWDRRGLVRAWLEAHGQVTHDRELTRVRVTRYALGPP
ncbi:MAG: glycosyltransferase family 39 protein [Caldilineales bacterium]|nr:glycosyltransferase family 39 protein [Caldilineales bacterium]MDW8319066.1 glycosyltransferase family 39 protein [Anaerolineae bacterium]